MHGVRGVIGANEVCHIDADVGVVAGVVDVPLGVVRVGDVAAVGFEKDGVAN